MGKIPLEGTSAVPSAGAEGGDWVNTSDDGMLPEEGTAVDGHVDSIGAETCADTATAVGADGAANDSDGDVSLAGANAGDASGSPGCGTTSGADIWGFSRVAAESGAAGRTGAALDDSVGATIGAGIGVATGVEAPSTAGTEIGAGAQETTACEPRATGVAVGEQTAASLPAWAVVARAPLPPPPPPPVPATGASE
jgi:hypothetical protein